MELHVVSDATPTLAFVGLVYGYIVMAGGLRMYTAIAEGAAFQSSDERWNYTWNRA